MINTSAWDLRVLEHRWRRARPFAHIVLPNAVDEEGCRALIEALDDEPADRIVAEIYEVNATGENWTQPTLCSFSEELTSDAMLAAVTSISGTEVTTAKARGYAYTSGHYLLPHADRDVDDLRKVAFALYIAVTDDLEGGELELFDCEAELGQIIRTTPAGRIAPCAGTLILFDVSNTSLHQVREVTAGTRGSISGWFY